MVPDSGISRRLPAVGPPALLELAPLQVDVDEFLHRTTEWYGLRDEDELRPGEESVGPTGITYLRLQQFYRGLPVVGSQVIVASQDGFVQTATGRFVSDIDLDVQARLSPGDAVRVVSEAALVRSPDLPPAGREALSLVVVEDTAQRVRLAYAVELPFADVQTFWAHVDANTGELVHLDDGRREATGTVTHSYEGPVTISVSPDPSGYVLKSEEGLFYTRNANNSAGPPVGSTDVTSPTTMFTTSWHADAHYSAGVTFEYLLKYLNRYGWDGVGTQLDVFSNVMWANSGFITSNGKNHIEVGNTSPSGPTNWGSVDLLGHEIGHAVTYSTVGVAVPGATNGLIFQGESGALDESFADILGTLVEFYARKGKVTPGNWTLFEQMFPTGVRSMEDPPAKNHPDAYNHPLLWKPTSLPADHGGVHSNSGVGNKWFYLLADDVVPAGVIKANTFGTQYQVRPLGLDASGLIAYIGLFNMAPASQYVDARAATLAAATQLCTVQGQPLIGTDAYTSVWEAWRAVAVGAAADLPPVAWLQPAPKATGVNPASVTLEFAADWGPADVYTIEIDTKLDFPNPIKFTAGPADTSWDAGVTKVKKKIPNGFLTANTPYFWRVINDNTALLPPLTRKVCARAPQAFTTGPWQVALEAPKGPDQHPWALEFKWETFPGILEYQFELYNGPDPSSDLEWKTTVSSPPYVLDVRMAHDYHWRVRPVSSAGEPGQWTAMQQFSTHVPHGELSSPANEADVYPWHVPLEWKEIKGAASHRLDLTDYPECFPPGVNIEIKTVEIPGEKHGHEANFQPTWEGSHQHCWRTTPIGPELFEGKYKGEQGTMSDVWKFKTKDHDTLPGSVAPEDRVLSPAYWEARTPYLLFPSALGIEDLQFSWQGVQHAISYQVEYFPIMGTVYTPDGLALLVGDLPYAPATPGIVGQEPPTTQILSPLSMTSMYFAPGTGRVYGFWYRIVAHGPDGTRSPSPPWAAVTPTWANMFQEDQYLVPHDYAPLVQQERPRNTGVILLRPTPVEIVNAGSDGLVWDSNVGNWPGWAIQASAPDGGSTLWAPWSTYYGAEFIGSGCDPATNSGNSAPDADDPVSLLTYFGPGSALSISLRVEESYGEDGFGDPSLWWASSPFADTSEAAPFAVSSSCIDVTLPEPEDYGGDDGAPPDEPEPDEPIDSALAFSLSEASNDDFDMIIVDPDGAKYTYETADHYIQDTIDSAGPDVAYWASPAVGTYDIYVHVFSKNNCAQPYVTLEALENGVVQETLLSDPIILDPGASYCYLTDAIYGPWQYTY